MTYRSRLAVAAGLLGAVAMLPALPAEAGCKRMGFLVNDYGKDGPTKDAQEGLDKHIAQWAAEQGIEKYTVGKKEVSCELFLNLIVVDEHTCTASAMVCWGGDVPGKAGGQQAKAKKGTDEAAKSETAKVEPAKVDGGVGDTTKAALSNEASPKTAEAKPEDFQAGRGEAGGRQDRHGCGQG